jgi:hypothetical protein
MSLYRVIILGHLMLFCAAIIGLVTALCFAHFLKAFGCLVALWFLGMIKIKKEQVK